MRAFHSLVPLAFCFLSASRAAEYFPLDPGNRWTYACEGCSGNEAVVSVLRLGPGFIQVDFLGTEIKVSFTPRAGELDIELPGEGFVPYYRFNEESWLHRDVFSCDDRREIAAASREEVVETPAGTFSGCLRLDYRDGLCQDGGTLSEWWKLGIGRVKWIGNTIAGPRAWLLKSFEEGRKPTPFLRGDANGDGKVDISDAVLTLVWLFGGGAQPTCRDANDSDDNGQIQLTDAVRVLNFLFLGVGTIPPPGPFAPGFDATPDDPFTCGDPPLLICHQAGSSTLPGVSFDLLDNPCTFTLAQAAQGVSLVYRTKIEHDLPRTTSFSLDAGACDEPDESGLATLEVITGGGQRYCICDSGRCSGTSHQRDLASGIFEHSFQWDGKNWEGPSDTLNPKGPPFPPGAYELTVRARGTYLDASGVEQPFDISASAELHLVE